MRPTAPPICPPTIAVRLIFKEDAIYAIGRAGDVKVILQHLLSSSPGETLKTFLHRRGCETGSL